MEFCKFNQYFDEFNLNYNIFRSQKYLEELPELSAHHRKQSQVPKLLNSIRKGNASNGVQLGAERPIGQIIRIIEKSSVVDFHALWLLDGLGTLANIIEAGLQPNSEVSRVAVTKAVQLYRNACSSCKQIAQHSILGGSILVLLDALNFTLKVRFEINFHLLIFNLTLKFKDNSNLCFKQTLLCCLTRMYAKQCFSFTESRYRGEEFIVSSGSINWNLAGFNCRSVELEIFRKRSNIAPPSRFRKVSLSFSFSPRCLL